MKQGMVEKVKKVNSNESSYYKLKIDGETYSLWSSLPKTVGKGSEVKFKYQTREKDGKEFKNITELKPLENGKPDHTDKRILALSISGWLLDKKDEPIELMELLKKAARIHSWLKGDPDAIE
ncbi:hypothetical protein K9M78_01340 [Candidatus Bipolaricaulota bacterium]|nr:hypothetical protein [Candidatus Bipolaricaulota bacterium]